jgi:hypothetical protein
VAVSLEPHNTGGSDGEAEVRAHVAHALTNRPGQWRVSIVGSRENYGWEMQILGPIGVERSCTLVGRSGEHQPLAIANVLLSQGQELWQVMFVSRGPPFSACVDLDMVVPLSKRKSTQYAPLPFHNPAR